MSDLRLLEAVEFGSDSGLGNLLGIQPFMNREDYASEEAFFKRIDAYLMEASRRGWINARTVVALPEYVGTWLVVAGENRSILESATIAEASRKLVLRHPLSFALAVLRSKEKDRLSASLFRLKAASMARIYQAVFSRLAMKYSATIAAGSIILPEPSVIDGEISVGPGALYNTSFVFRPDGQVESRPVRKAYPTESEHAFLAAGLVEDIPVFDTPAGKLGVLVCADSWFPEPYRRLRSQEVELVIVPSALFPGDIWNKQWNGYNNASAPEDVDLRDVGSLTEQQAWHKYALAGRLSSSGAKAGLNLFLYGDLWDLGFTGGRWKLAAGEKDMEGSCDGSALVNFWL